MINQYLSLYTLLKLSGVSQAIRKYVQSDYFSERLLERYQPSTDCYKASTVLQKVLARNVQIPVREYMTDMAADMAVVATHNELPSPASSYHINIASVSDQLVKYWFYCDSGRTDLVYCKKRQTVYKVTDSRQPILHVVCRDYVRTKSSSGTFFVNANRCIMFQSKRDRNKTYSWMHLPPWIRKTNIPALVKQAHAVARCPILVKVGDNFYSGGADICYVASTSRVSVISEKHREQETESWRKDITSTLQETIAMCQEIQKGIKRKTYSWPTECYQISSQIQQAARLTKKIQKSCET